MENPENHWLFASQEVGQLGSRSGRANPSFGGMLTIRQNCKVGCSQFEKIAFQVGKLAEQWFFPHIFKHSFFGACVVTYIPDASRTHNLRADCLIHPDSYNSYFFVPLPSKKNQEITGGFKDSCSLIGWWLVLFLLTPFFDGNMSHPISPVAPRTEASTAEQLLRAELTEREREVGLKKSEKKLFLSI